MELDLAVDLALQLHQLDTNSTKELKLIPQKLFACLLVEDFLHFF
jgi:hypothetical protein